MRGRERATDRQPSAAAATVSSPPLCGTWTRGAATATGAGGEQVDARIEEGKTMAADAVESMDDDTKEELEALAKEKLDLGN